MTVKRSYNLWCDHLDCWDSGAFDSDTWPQWQTAAEIRAAARRSGWRRTSDGRDLCPDHAREGSAQ